MARLAKSCRCVEVVCGHAGGAGWRRGDTVLTIGVDTYAASSPGGSVNFLVRFFAGETLVDVRSSTGLAGRIAKIAKFCSCVEVESGLAGGAGRRRGDTVLTAGVDADVASS